MKKLPWHIKVSFCVVVLVVLIVGVAVWALQSSITTCRRYVPGIFSARCDRLRAKRMLRREP